MLFVFRMFGSIDPIHRRANNAAVINGVEREVFKDPITDPGKRSKKGRLTLENRAYPADEAAFAGAVRFLARQFALLFWLCVLGSLPP